MEVPRSAHPERAINSRRLQSEILDAEKSFNTPAAKHHGLTRFTMFS